MSNYRHYPRLQYAVISVFTVAVPKPSSVCQYNVAFSSGQLSAVVELDTRVIVGCKCSRSSLIGCTIYISQNRLYPYHLQSTANRCPATLPFVVASDPSVTPRSSGHRHLPPFPPVSNVLFVPSSDIPQSAFVLPVAP